MFPPRPVRTVDGMIAKKGAVRDDPSVRDLVIRARGGDKQAWDALVERYAPLVWSICRRHRLGLADAEDVGQSVWLVPTRAVDQELLAAERHAALREAFTCLGSASS